MASLKDARAALEANRDALRKAHGYRGAWVGFRKKGGVTTDEIVVVCAVGKKMPSVQLGARPAAPRVVGGVTVDVQEVPAETQEDGDRYRPAPGGCSVGHFRITAGTLGIVLRRNGKLGILSNNHVIADSNEASIGDRILQPGPHDGGELPIAVLKDFVRIEFEGGGGGGGAPPVGDFFECLLGCLFGGAPPTDRERRLIRETHGYHLSALSDLAAVLHGTGPRADGTPHADGNLVDAAWAEAWDGDESLLQLGWILDIGVPGGSIVIDPPLGLRVQKRGRTTELTKGRIVGVDAEVRVSGYGPTGATALFVDQLVIEADSGEFSAGGDSGSVILTDDDAGGELVGLLFAGGGGQTIANKMQHVFAAFPGLEA